MRRAFLSRKDELTRAAVESTQIGSALDGARARVVELQERRAAKDAEINMVAQTSCKAIKPSVRSLVHNVRVSLKTSVGDTFWHCSFDAQFHADSVIDGVTLHISENSAFEEDEKSNKGGDAVDLDRDMEIINL